MPAFGRPFLAMAAVILSADVVRAAGVEDANAAVLAARDGKYDDAIRLFTNAINGDDLNLKSRAQAYAYRGIAKATTGDYDGATDDLNRSVALNSDYAADSYAYRGYFELVLGDAQKASADLAKSAEMKIWPYNALWLWLTRMKANVPDSDAHSLVRNAAQFDLAQWPRPLVKFLMDQRRPGEVAGAADEG